MLKELEWKKYKYLKNALVANAVLSHMYIIDFGGTEYRNELNEVVDISSTDTIDVYLCDLDRNRLLDFHDCINEDDAKSRCQQHHNAIIWEWLFDSKPKVSNQRIITL